MGHQLDVSQFPEAIKPLLQLAQCFVKHLNVGEIQQGLANVGQKVEKTVDAIVNTPIGKNVLGAVNAALDKAPAVVEKVIQGLTQAQGKPAPGATPPKPAPGATPPKSAAGATPPKSAPGATSPKSSAGAPPTKPAPK